MFGQPRCREWTPLATQQLRLRNLIQIVGYNIHGWECCGQPGSLYYTLHTTTMSAPFYTSEKLLSSHPKWREIDSELIHKMSSVNVVVRVWRQTRHDNHNGHQLSAEIRHPQADTIVQTWGVNFSGLLHIGANLALDFTPKSFKVNTLVFQMIGGYFCSYESLRLEPSSGVSNFEHPGGIAIMGKEASPSRKIPIEDRVDKWPSSSPGLRTDSFESRHTSKSHSPPTGCFRQSFASVASSSSSSNKQDYYLRNVQESESRRKRNDSYNNSIYEHSPKSDTDIEIREYLGSDVSSDVLKTAGSVSVSSRDLIRMDIEESETAETYDHTKTEPVLKCRYSSLKFLKSEIRPSYTAEKLQKLHLLQYSIKKRSQAVQEIKERIYQKSAMENSENLSPQGPMADNGDFWRSERLSMSCREFSLLSGKHRHSSRSKDLGKILSESKTDLSKCTELKDSDETTVSRDKKQASVPPDIHLKSDKDGKTNDRGRRYPGHKVIDTSKPSDRRFTLPLNKLLEFKSQPSPSQRLRHSQLTRLAELSRFKRRLLQDERDASLARLRKLRLERGRLFEDNQDNGTELMHSYHLLSRKSEQLKELKKSETALRELCCHSLVLLQARRWRLVQDIQLVYPIQEEESGFFSILGILLPASRDTADGLRQCREADLAVALGRVAHCTALAAAMLGVPLRHALRLMGSRTKVLDQLARTESEIPLFARNKDSMLFRYGLFLLNKNIAQLLWSAQRVMTPCPGDTLGNLRKLLTPPAGLEASRMFGSASSMETLAPFLLPSPLPSTHSLRSLVPRHHVHQGRPFNRFKDSVDGTSPNAAMRIRKHRNSRSVGSYIDEKSLQSLEMNPSSVIGSELSLNNLSLQNKKPKSEMKHSSTSPCDNIQNLLSFSESDLTKVTDTISPESSSSVVDFSPKMDGRVIFELGDKTQSNEASNNRENADNRNTSHVGTSNSDQNKSRLEDQQVISLQSDVEKLSKEIAMLCCKGLNDAEIGRGKSQSPANKKGISASFNESDSDAVKCLNFSNLSDGARIQRSNSKSESDLTKMRGLKSTAKDDFNLENRSTTTQKQLCAVIGNDSDYVNCCDSSGPKFNEASCSIDIEKIGDYPPFCNHPCSTKCPRLMEDCPQLNTGYDQCDNGDEIMHDVIVLPSAEAILTSSSHFTDPFLYDDESIKQSLALREAVLNSLQNDDDDFHDDLNNENLINRAKEALDIEDRESTQFNSIASNKSTNSQVGKERKVGNERDSLNDNVSFRISDGGAFDKSKYSNQVYNETVSSDNSSYGSCKNFNSLGVENVEIIPQSNCNIANSQDRSCSAVSGCNVKASGGNIREHYNIENDECKTQNAETSGEVLVVNVLVDSGNECSSNVSVESSKECRESLEISSGASDELLSQIKNGGSVAILEPEQNKLDASHECSVNGYS